MAKVPAGPSPMGRKRTFLVPAWNAASAGASNDSRLPSLATTPPVSARTKPGPPGASSAAESGSMEWKTTRQTALAGSAETPWAITSAWPLAGEKISPACQARVTRTNPGRPQSAITTASATSARRPSGRVMQRSLWRSERGARIERQRARKHPTLSTRGRTFSGCGGDDRKGRGDQSDFFPDCSAILMV